VCTDVSQSGRNICAQASHQHQQHQEQSIRISISMSMSMSNARMQEQEQMHPRLLITKVNWVSSQPQLAPVATARCKCLLAALE